jgi:hypothetical protein
MPLSFVKDYTNSQIVTQKEAIYEKFLEWGDPEILAMWDRFNKDEEAIVFTNEEGATFTFDPDAVSN